MIQFAYASNMNVKGFSAHLPSVKKIGNAYLPGYELAFNLTADDLSAKANVIGVDNPEVAVWGILLEFNDNDAELLDSGGWPENLEPKQLPCIDEAGNLYTARVFVTKPHAVNDSLLPYDWYVEKIVTLAEINNLPEAYIAKLKLTDAKPDPDVKRKERRLKKFRESL
jgi:hypothetical protein